MVGQALLAGLRGAVELTVPVVALVVDVEVPPVVDRAAVEKVNDFS